jgi:S1-C subfamily serine protease
VVPYENRSQTYLSDTGSDLVREQIKTGFESVVRIQNTVTYRTYQFQSESLPERSDLSGADLESLSAHTVIESHSNAGTATILSNENERTSLFTASHVVTFPDTIMHYEPGSDQLVEAVSIQQSVSHFFFGSTGVFEFEVLANDPDLDLALLVYRWGRDGDPGLTALSIEPGDFDDLDWTDRVYALGYPRGVRMVTSGMISRQEGNSRRTFAVDAIFNRGFSGGPIFAIRTDGSGLEWMGILTSSSAENEFYLGPDYLNEDEHSQGRPFTGIPIVQQTSRINYGVSFGVDIQQITEFFNENRSLLRRMRIPIPDFPD